MAGPAALLRLETSVTMQNWSKGQRTMQTGLLITFEGLDGTGKSTQLRRAVQYLRQCGHRVVLTREPGGTRVGERVREILLASKTGKLAPLAELALMYAARAQLLDEVVRPALARGEVVVSDRYNTASFAYQGYGRELGAATVRAFDRIICGTTQPDLTIILDLDPERPLARAAGRDPSGGRARTDLSGRAWPFTNACEPDIWPSPARRHGG